MAGSIVTAWVLTIPAAAAAVAAVVHAIAHGLVRG